MSIADKLTQIAENQQRVYDAGYNKGKAESGNNEDAYNTGYEQGYEISKQDFASILDNNGTRKIFNNMFGGCSQMVEAPLLDTHNGVEFNSTFKDCTGLVTVPQYDFTNATIINGMFQGCSNLENIPIINTTKDVSIYATFRFCSKIKEITGTSRWTTMAYSFEGCKLLERINAILVDCDAYSFNSCNALKEVTFEEESISNRNAQLRHCKLLSKNSIISVINGLNSSSSGGTLSLSLTAVNNAFETVTGLADGSTSQEWLALRETKTNWTIALTS